MNNRRVITNMRLLRMSTIYRNEQFRVNHNTTKYGTPKEFAQPRNNYQNKSTTNNIIAKDLRIESHHNWSRERSEIKIFTETKKLQLRATQTILLQINQLSSTRLILCSFHFYFSAPVIIHTHTHRNNHVIHLYYHIDKVK